MSEENSILSGFRRFNPFLRRRAYRPSAASLIMEGMAVYAQFPRDSQRQMMRMYLAGWGYSDESIQSVIDTFYGETTDGE